jgi:VWFA-related protein
VVETIRLESGHTLTGIVGSNPTLSASQSRKGGPLLIRRFLVFVVALQLLAPARLFPQTPGPQDISKSLPSPTIRISTRLVLVDVVVTDKHGQPILGLKPEDFAVAEKGKPEKVVFFTPPGQPTAAAPALPAGVFSNRAEYRSPGGPPTVILLDVVNTPPQHQAVARLQMLKFAAEQFKPGNEVAVLTLGNELDILLDFTTDPQLLQQALQQFAAKRPAPTNDPPDPVIPATTSTPGAGVSMARLNARMEQFENQELTDVIDRRVDQTLAAMRSLGRMLSGIPGRKNVIWLSAGFPFSLLPQNQVATLGSLSWLAKRGRNNGGGCGSKCSDPVNNDETSLNPGDQRRYDDDIRNVAAELAASEVAIYPVDVRGIEATPASSSYENQQTMEEIARETGGFAFINRNDIHNGVDLVFADHASSYTLGYYPRDRNWDGTYRTISIKVDRQGAELRHRRGYFAVDPAAEADKNLNRQLREALRDAVPDTQVTFDAKIAAIDHGKTRIEFMLDATALSAEDTPKGKRLNADFQVAIVGSNGKTVLSRGMKLDRVVPVATYQQIAEQGLSVHIDIEPPAGSDQVRLAVRDNHTGYVGSLEARLK